MGRARRWRRRARRGSSCGPLTGGGGRAARSPRQRPPQDGVGARRRLGAGGGRLRHRRCWGPGGAGSAWVGNRPWRCLPLRETLQTKKLVIKRPESAPSSGKATNIPVTPGLPPQGVAPQRDVPPPHTPPLPQTACRRRQASREGWQVPIGPTRRFHGPSCLFTEPAGKGRQDHRPPSTLGRESKGPPPPLEFRGVLPRRRNKLLDDV